MAGIKNNIFDHVLYEFEMYIYSYSELIRLCPPKGLDQLKYNMAIECYSVHLRNILEFFNCDGGENCIDVNMILKGSHNYALSGEPYKSLMVKQYVNKSVDHLSRQRFCWDGDEIKDLAERQKKIPIVMFKQYISIRIKAFLKQLLSQHDVKPEWINFCNEQLIQMRINVLLQYLQNVPDETF